MSNQLFKLFKIFTISLLICSILSADISSNGDYSLTYTQGSDNLIEFTATLKNNKNGFILFGLGLNNDYYPADVIICGQLNGVWTCEDGFMSGNTEVADWPAPTLDSNRQVLSPGPMNTFATNDVSGVSVTGTGANENLVFKVKKAPKTNDRKWDYNFRNGQNFFVVAYNVGGKNWPDKAGIQDSNTKWWKGTVSMSLNNALNIQSGNGQKSGVLDFHTDFSVNYESSGSDIIFTARLKNGKKGWIAWGHGRIMYPADVIVCGKQNNQLGCWDAYVSGNIGTTNFPGLFFDDNMAGGVNSLKTAGGRVGTNDITVLEQSETNTEVTFKVKRKKVSDDPFDASYTDGTNEIIYAFNSNGAWLPGNSNKHTSSGSLELVLNLNAQIINFFGVVLLFCFIVLLF